MEIGPLQLRWYGLAYVLGVVLGVTVLRKEFKSRLQFNSDQLLGFMTYVMVGILLGGRLGYVLFYDLVYYMQFPARVLALWQGGMSFHGGAIGAAIAVGLFAKFQKKPIWPLLDLLSVGATIGLGLGRLANFINGELFGRVSDAPWAMVFPGGGPLPRHPSQLYEAFFEGLILFLVLFLLMKKAKLKDGQLFAAFLFFYGIIRFSLEFFREPDTQLGFFFSWLTMGQLLSGVMGVAGIVLSHRQS